MLFFLRNFDGISTRVSVTEIANDSKSATWKCPHLMLVSSLHFHCVNSLNSLVRDLFNSGGLFAPAAGEMYR